MRTTIELKPEHRARLLELAARRGEKGFSSVIGEAIEAFLSSLTEKEKLTERALQARGAFCPADANRLRREVQRLHEHWR